MSTSNLWTVPAFVWRLLVVYLCIVGLQWTLLFTAVLHPLDALDLNRFGAPKSTPFSAVIVILCRNSDLDELLPTLRVFEQRFNHRFRYPYVLLNDQEFTEEFTKRVQQTVREQRRDEDGLDISYGRVPSEHWSLPAWINETRMHECMLTLQSLHPTVLYADNESYRHMCRYQSGFFFQHPLLAHYDYYWRVEPESRLLCQVLEDPFMEMHQRQAKYGFTQVILEDAPTVRSLWKHTLDFAARKRQLSGNQWNPSMLGFFESYAGDYNLCHFWSNFEIASLAFLRSAEYTAFFDYLDRTGG